MTHKIIEQLRKERRVLEISQDAIGVAVGVSQNHLCALENGRHLPRLDFLDTWANALGYELALVKKQ